MSDPDEWCVAAEKAEAKILSILLSHIFACQVMADEPLAWAWGEGYAIFEFEEELSKELGEYIN